MIVLSHRARQDHWERIYQTKGERGVSWFEESSLISLDLILATGAQSDASIIDVGGGASRLVDALIDGEFGSLAVLDLSERALAISRTRLGARGAIVNWIVTDITKWKPGRTYDVWHDRAAFHFLTEPSEHSAYARCVLKAVRPGGHVIIGTFAPDGPEFCSGLPVVRPDAAALGKILGGEFKLIECRQHEHITPAGDTQRFQFCCFQRV